MQTYTFTRENGSWYIEFTEELKGFTKSELVRLEGAGLLLDALCNGKRKLTLTIATSFFEKALELELVQMGEAPKGGGYYLMKDHRGKVLEQELWLCDVPLFIFGDIPRYIYLRREKPLSMEHTQ